MSKYHRYEFVALARPLTRAPARASRAPWLGLIKISEGPINENPQKTCKKSF
jgi:hypothetical protein